MDFFKSNEIDTGAGENIQSKFKLGEAVESKILSVDRKNRSILLSIKAKDHDEEKAAMQAVREQEDSASPGTIGDLIKAEMDS